MNEMNSIKFNLTFDSLIEIFDQLLSLIFERYEIINRLLRNLSWILWILIFVVWRAVL